MLNQIRETLFYIRKEKAWQATYGPQAPKEGDPAPDFTLFDVDGKQPVTLSDLHGGHPVALVFGSFT